MRNDWFENFEKADVIYNGTQSETISDEMIKKYNNGTISAIRTDGKGVYDLIKVDGYRTMFVKMLQKV